MFRYFILAILLFTPALEALPAQVIIIRHAEKPPIGSDLSLKGEQRAAALVPFFLGNPLVVEFGQPVAIYAPKPTPEGTGIRSLLTVTPLASALNQTPCIDYERNDVKGLTDEIMSNPDFSGRMVLICWAHDEIPEIADKLGAKAPSQWGDSYDRLWLITYGSDITGKKGSNFENMPQQLLYGDTTK